MEQAEQPEGMLVRLRDFGAWCGVPILLVAALAAAGQRRTTDVPYLPTSDAVV